LEEKCSYRTRGIRWVFWLIQQFINGLDHLLFDGSFDPSPGKRHSIWSLIVGGYFTWVTIYGVNQSQVQRYLTVASMRQAKKYNFLVFNSTSPCIISFERFKCCVDQFSWTAAHHLNLLLRWNGHVR
jgi:hypothetical protein